MDGPHPLDVRRRQSTLEQGGGGVVEVAKRVGGEKGEEGQEGEGGGRGGSGRARLGRATVSEQGKPAGLVPWRMRGQGVQGCGQESEPRTRGARGHLRMACASAGPFRSSGTGTVLR